MEGVFKGKNLCGNLVTKPNTYGETLVNNESQRTLLIFFAYFGKILSSGSIFQLLDNQHNESIYFHTFDLYGADVVGRHCYEFIFMDYKNTTGYQFYSWNRACVKNYGYAKKNIGINDVYNSDLFNDIISEHNICTNLSNTTITKVRRGDKVYNISDHKEYTNDGSAWRDALGNQL
jgi:hypothetical protein